VTLTLVPCIRDVIVSSLGLDSVYRDNFSGFLSPLQPNFWVTSKIKSLWYPSKSVRFIIRYILPLYAIYCDVLPERECWSRNVRL
jgi:hypothetical protein